MRLSILLAIFLLMAPGLSFAQNEKSEKITLSPEKTKELLSTIKVDTVKILGEHSRAACHCIDSVLQSRKAGDPDPNESIISCIEKETETYQMMMKFYSSLFSSENKIILNTNHKSAEFKKYYKDIESWLMDSCSSLKLLAGSDDNITSEFSISKNPEANHQYNEGINYFTKEDYNAAMPYFKKAVEIDPKFVFALDNLAVCYRRTGNLDMALTTYNESLKIYPAGKTPLQNIPVIYELQKDYDKALAGYEKMLQHYPDDAESYYGLGRILISFKNDIKKGLDYMCKAYNSYVKMNSPYRVDAEKNMAYVYQQMKAQGKEEEFFKILDDNHIKAR